MAKTVAPTTGAAAVPPVAAHKHAHGHTPDYAPGAHTPKAGPGERRVIQRKSFQARLTHAVTAFTCLYLTLSGLFVFIPPLSAWAGQGVVTALRMSHRIVGVIFVLFPIISAIMAPKGVGHILKNLFHRWTKDDVKWLIKFIPYLFNVKKTHMPDQDEVKSGQRVADGAIWGCAFMMAFSGVGLVLGDTVFQAGPFIMGWLRILHDVFFVLMIIFVLAHIYLGAGIFQPYRGTARIMWGDGKVNESDALYHWGKYARRELVEGINVTLEKTGKDSAAPADGNGVDSCNAATGSANGTPVAACSVAAAGSEAAPHNSTESK